MLHKVNTGGGWKFINVQGINIKKERAMTIKRINSNLAEAQEDSIDIDMLEEIIGYPLRRAQAFVYADYAKTVGELGIRPAQFAAMVIINNNPGLTQSALASVMGIDRSAVVSLIDVLEEQRLVARIPSVSDRRSYSIMITVKGRDKLEKIKAQVIEQDKRISASLTEEERKELIRLLTKLYA